MDRVEEERLAALMLERRWGALATVNDGRPLATNVAYAMDSEAGGLLIHVSKLARHTANLLENRSASLAISEREQRGCDPQTLARVSLQGKVVVISRDDEAYSRYRACYLNALPEAEQLFGFADFMLFYFAIDQVRFIAGFGKSYTLSPTTLQRICCDY